MSHARTLPPIHELRRRLAYRSDGVLIWKRPRSNRTKPGNKAGFPNGDGYLRTKFDNKRFLCHRLIWAILKREDPLDFYIDHINGDKLDNRIQNLRKASHNQNLHNQKGAKGYYFSERTKRWTGQIRLNGKRLHLGCFDTEEQAREAYLRAKEKLHGDFMPDYMKHELSIIDQPTFQLDFFND
jgi:hypothetical protein